MQRITDTNWSIKVTTDFEPSLNRFRRYLEDQGRRETTIEGYLGNVNRYLKFAKTDRPLDHDLERFRNSLAEKKTSRSTKNQYNYAIKAYHAMLGKRSKLNAWSLTTKSLTTLIARMSLRYSA